MLSELIKHSWQREEMSDIYLLTYLSLSLSLLLSDMRGFNTWGWERKKSIFSFFLLVECVWNYQKGFILIVSYSLLLLLLPLFCLSIILRHKRETDRKVFQLQIEIVVVKYMCGYSAYRHRWMNEWRREKCNIIETLERRGDKKK